MENSREIYQTPTVDEALRWRKEVHEPLAPLYDAVDNFERMTILKRFYTINHDKIMESPKRWIVKTPFELCSLFTPIEWEAWISILAKGGMVFYPQYPVLNYFLDFGNPHKKIAIELDGKDYHDRKRDLVRDKRLKESGWTVYRITGSEMVNRSYLEFSDCEEQEFGEEEKNEAVFNWITKTGDGVIHAIGAMHFWPRNKPDWFYSYCELTLSLHTLIH